MAKLSVLFTFDDQMFPKKIFIEAQTDIEAARLQAISDRMLAVFSKGDAEDHDDE